MHSAASTEGTTRTTNSMEEHLENNTLRSNDPHQLLHKCAIRYNLLTAQSEPLPSPWFFTGFSTVLWISQAIPRRHRSAYLENPIRAKVSQFPYWRLPRQWPSGSASQWACLRQPRWGDTVGSITVFLFSEGPLGKKALMGSPNEGKSGAFLREVYSQAYQYLGAMYLYYSVHKWAIKEYPGQWFDTEEKARAWLIGRNQPTIKG
jgi:hypothetical protein